MYKTFNNSGMRLIRGIGLHNKIGKLGRLDMRFQLYIVCSAKPGGRPEPVGASSLFKRSNRTRWDRFSASPSKNFCPSFYGGQPGIVCTIPYLNRNADRLTAKVTVCRDHLSALLSCGKIISRSSACATAVQQIISRSTADRQQIDSRSRSNLYTSMAVYTYSSIPVFHYPGIQVCKYGSFAWFLSSDSSAFLPLIFPISRILPVMPDAKSVLYLINVDKCPWKNFSEDCKKFLDSTVITVLLFLIVKDSVHCPK